MVVTTARGLGNVLAMAEYTVGAILHFAKGLNRAGVDRDAKAFDFRAYRPLQIEGKTVCVVGAGGIGLEVGRLAAALGMRVIGTRRNPRPGEPLPPGFSELAGPAELDRMLAESHFVAVCCQWTPETNRLFNDERFAAMRPGSVIVNVARGEIIDEEALIAALQRDHLRGAALDVYVGEFEGPPDARLWSDPRVLITPHISSATDEDRHRGVELFCDNLRAWVAGSPCRTSSTGSAATEARRLQTEVTHGHSRAKDRCGPQGHARRAGAGGRSKPRAGAERCHGGLPPQQRPRDQDRGCSTIIDRDPGAVWAYVSRGAVYIAKSEYDHAIRDLTIAIDLSAPSAGAAMSGSYNSRAWAYFKSAKAAQGLPDAERSLQLRPNNDDALDTRGHILEVLGRREEAIADFRKVLALDPNDPNAPEARKALENGAQP